MLSIRYKFIYHISTESSASTHVCIFPSKYNLAYSRGSSIAKAFKAHSEQGVVFNPSSASLQSIRKKSQKIKGSILMIPSPVIVFAVYYPCLLLVQFQTITLEPLFQPSP